MKNKLKYAVSAATTAALTLPSLVLAQWDAGARYSSQAGLSTYSIGDILRIFLNWTMMILGTVAVIAFVIAGIMYITAAGDEDRVAKAKGIMTYAIIGIVVALIGLVIVRLLSYFLGVTGGQM